MVTILILRVCCNFSISGQAAAECLTAADFRYLCHTFCDLLQIYVRDGPANQQPTRGPLILNKYLFW